MLSTGPYPSSFLRLPLPFGNEGLLKIYRVFSTNHDSVNESVSDRGVYRTAPATPGRLKIKSTSNRPIPPLQPQEAAGVGHRNRTVVLGCFTSDSVSNFFFLIFRF